MKDIIDKLSSYNIFNYLFPGILFAGIGSHYTPYKLIFENIVIGVFVYYFYGLVISRIGSLVIEPLLKKLNFIRFAPYAQYIVAAQADEKIEVLSETNNMYRTLISLLACLLLTKIYSQLQGAYSWFTEFAPSGVILALLILFVFSYKKQTQYVTNRIAAALKKNRSDGDNVE